MTAPTDFDKCQERDEARLEAKAYRKMAIKYRDLWYGQKHPTDQFSASEDIVDAEKQRIIDEWKKGA